MSFPTNEVINSWFQDAHTSAVAVGGSVYVMEKHAEHKVVSNVLRWAYVNMLDELEDLNYPTGSRINVRINELLEELYPNHNVEYIKEDEPVDDYNDDEDEDEDEDEEVEVDVDPALALEVVNALIKALIDKK